MEFNDYLDEFVADWQLTGHAPTTATTYRRYLDQLWAAHGDEIDLATVKLWLSESGSRETARARARAVRAFGRWAIENDGPEWLWWSRVPLASTRPTPQPTVTEDVYKAVRGRCTRVRDALVVELLWSTGLRVSEIARLSRDDVNLSDRFVVVRTSKTGKPRLAPLSDQACRLIRRHPAQPDGRLVGMSSNAIQQLMKRLDAPSPHAWRRGWAVHALKRGISQVSVQTAAGWSSGAMVARYTSAMSAQLAIDEFSGLRNGRTSNTSNLERPIRSATQQNT